MATLTAIPSVSRLSSRIIRILGCNPGPMTLQGTNTYLVGTGKRRALIDTGDSYSSKDYLKLLTEVLEREPATIEHLVITHWHHDHTGGVRSIKEVLKSRPNDDLSIIPTVWKFERASGDLGGIAEEDDMESWRRLKDNQTIEIEGAKLRILFTPGHTTDHACVVLEEENALFSGDCILGETSAVFEELGTYLESLGKILKENTDVIYPGHGPVVNDPNAKISQYIEHRLAREREILKCLKNSDGHCEIMDIVKIMYKDTPKNLWPAAALNVQHHLDKLLKEKKVLNENERWTLLQARIQNL